MRNDEVGALTGEVNVRVAVLAVVLATGWLVSVRNDEVGALTGDVNVRVAVLAVVLAIG